MGNKNIFENISIVIVVIMIAVMIAFTLWPISKPVPTQKAYDKYDEMYPEDFREDDSIFIKLGQDCRVELVIYPGDECLDADIDKMRTRISGIKI